MLTLGYQPDDPDIENMTTTYTRALTKLIPVFFPHILYRLTPTGQPLFADFAAMIQPTEFAPGKTFGSGAMAPIDYMVGLAEGTIAPPKNLNIRTILPQAESMAFRFHFPQYATRLAAEWAKRGFKETLVDFPTLNARSKFWGDDQRAAFKNWEETDNIRNPLGERQGIDERILLRELLRRTDMMVMLQAAFRPACHGGHEGPHCAWAEIIYRRTPSCSAPSQGRRMSSCKWRRRIRRRRSDACRRRCSKRCRASHQPGEL